MIAQTQSMDGAANPTGPMGGAPKPIPQAGQQTPSGTPPAPTPPTSLPTPQMVPGAPVPAASAPPIVPSGQMPPSLTPTTNGNFYSSAPLGSPAGPTLSDSPHLTPAGNGNQFTNVPLGTPDTTRLLDGPSATSPAPATSPGTSPVPGVAGAAMTPINPAQDLRSQTITPTTDPRLAATQSDVSTLANNLTHGPNRFDLAQSNFDAFAKATEPQYQQDLRSATEDAAANGRLGSGMLSNNYETLAEARARALDTQRTQLFNNALEGTIGDTRANVGLLSGLEGQQFGEGQANRNELRDERGYENGLSQQALQNRVQEAQLEDQLTNSAFSRGADATQLGYEGNPASAQLTASMQQGDQANQSFNDIGSLLRMMALSSALSGSGGSSAGAPSSPGLGITPQMLQQFMTMYQNGGTQ